MEDGGNEDRCGNSTAGGELGSLGGASGSVELLVSAYPSGTLGK